MTYTVSSGTLNPTQLNYAALDACLIVTVKPFNLAAQKVGDLACKIILAPLFWRIKTIRFEIL